MWPNLIEKSDLLPCPKCGSTDLEVFANRVECYGEIDGVECDYIGPDHGISENGRPLPEFLCDWRQAIEDWNDAINSKS